MFQIPKFCEDKGEEHDFFEVVIYTSYQFVHAVNAEYERRYGEKLLTRRLSTVKGTGATHIACVVRTCRKCEFWGCLSPQTEQEVVDRIERSLEGIPNVDLAIMPYKQFLFIKGLVEL